MLFWAPMILQFDVASLHSRKISFLSPVVGRNAGIDEERKMNDPAITDQHLSTSSLPLFSRE